VLVTVLSSRTVPLIRYELADRVTLATDPCPCGRPGPRIAAVHGRARDVLRIAGSLVHPTALTAVLDTAPVAAWQVVQAGDHLRVLVVAPGAGFDGPALGAAVAAASGAAVDVDVVDTLPSGAGGKAERFVVSDGGR
jgi:phenylacetate-CoA ligase